MRSALAKGHIRVGAAVKMRPVRVGKDALIPVAGYEPQHHLVPFGDGLAAQHGILGGGAAEMHGRRCQPDDLVSRRVIDGTRLQLFQQLGVTRQQIQRHGDGIACRVISGSHQQAEEILEVGQCQPGIGVNDTVQDPARVHRLFAGKDGFRIIIEINAGRRPERHQAIGIAIHLVDHMVGKIGVGIANQRIPFFNQPVEIAVRQPQNAAQHHHRQLLCNHINSIKTALGKGSIDNIACQGADHLFILGDGRA